jgi:hypothetical protein
MRSGVVGLNQADEPVFRTRYEIMNGGRVAVMLFLKLRKSRARIGYTCIKFVVKANGVTVGGSTLKKKKAIPILPAIYALLNPNFGETESCES